MSVEDNRLLQELLQTLVEGIDGASWVDGFGTIAEARSAFRNGLAPDMILLDLRMPDGRGLDLLRELSRSHQSSRIAITSGTIDDYAITQCLRHQVAGFIDKTTSKFDDWRNGIAQLVNGDVYYSRSVCERFDAHKWKSTHWSRMLTDREEELLPLLADGLSNAVIAESYSLSPDTIQVHRKNVMRKCAVESTPALMSWARRIGFI